jgi:hypothetical protein
MRLVGTVTAGEAKDILDSLLPFTIRLDDQLGAERFVVLESVSEITMVEGRGLRVRCTGNVQWSRPIGAVKMQVKVAQALLVPTVVQDGTVSVLRLSVEIEALDFEWIPDLVDAKIAQIIEKKLAARPLEWRIGERFKKSISLPDAIEPVRTVDVGARDPSCTVTEDEMTFVVHILASVSP